jgi:hypothetical protein
MSKKDRLDSYEVGYGKPPRNTQFRKGISGNPKGRPKKTLDFDHALLRESRVYVTLNENGRPLRITKHELLIKQLLHKAIGGNIPAARTYLDRHQIASEKIALLEAAQAREAERCKDLRRLTDEELEQMILAAEKREEEQKKKEEEQKKKKLLNSNAD